MDAMGDSRLIRDAMKTRTGKIYYGDTGKPHGELTHGAFSFIVPFYFPHHFARFLPETCVMAEITPFLLGSGIPRLPLLDMLKGRMVQLFPRMGHFVW